MVTTHFALKIMVLEDSEWKIKESNQFLVWIWGRYGYTTGMLLKMAFHIMVGVALVSVMLMIQYKVTSPWMEKWMFVLISVLTIYYFYTVASNVRAIQKATTHVNANGAV